VNIEFFKIDNKSGYKTKEVWFSKNFPDEYLKINNYCSQINLILSFKEKIWFYYNNITERPKCLTCGKEIKFRNRLDVPYGDFCSLECINNNHFEMIKRQTKTYKEKYGVNFYPEHKDFIKKQKTTKLNRYGNENYNNIDKNKTTKLNRYGNENYNNSIKYQNTCFLKYNSLNYSTSETYKADLVKNYKNLYPNLNIITVNKFDVDVLCDKCNKIYNITKQNLYERSKRGYETCIFCNPIGQNNQSGNENEINDFLKTLNMNTSTSNRILPNHQEIDILIESHKLGIEFDGVYWHNELFVPDDYHLKKTKNAAEIGINLIHIFEDEWKFKQEIIKSILRNKLNKIENTIYARKCDIYSINHKICSDFLENNHIQGNANSKIRLGLFYNNELVSVMTFSKGRILMGGKSNEWELTRFCNKINFNIIGGADKLFKYFLKHYQPNKIISYSDKRLFNGGLYKKLGFIEKSHSKPNYWYVRNGIREYRFNYRKSRLIQEGFDPNKTEKEIMFERKIYRIYDCGVIRWEFIS
jgi:hypothetical protein